MSVAIKIHLHRTCDRCSSPFEESVYQSPTEIPTSSVLKLTLSVQGQDLFVWNDLCSSCEKAVDNLLDRLRLLGPKKSKINPATVDQEEALEALPEVSPKADTPPF